jgi:hypothetical protein
MTKLRIVTLRFGTGRQKMAIERWTNPKLSRRTCVHVIRATILWRGIGGADRTQAGEQSEKEEEEEEAHLARSRPRRPLACPADAR